VTGGVIGSWLWAGCALLWANVVGITCIWLHFVCLCSVNLDNNLDNSANRCTRLAAAAAVAGHIRSGSTGLPDMHLVTGHANGSVVVWDPSNDTLTPVLLVGADRCVCGGGGVGGGADEHSKPTHGCAVLSWGVAGVVEMHLVTGHANGSVVVWDPSNDTLTPVLLVGADMYGGGGCRRVGCNTYIDSGMLRWGWRGVLMCSGTANGSVVVWDPSNDTLTPVLLVWAERCVADNIMIGVGCGT
jgi:WD40 repeat protein